MLKQLKIRDLKSIDEALLKLAPLTILTGVNSSGKSTVIQALMLLVRHSGSINRFSMEELTRYLSDFASIRNKKANAKSVDIETIDHSDSSHDINITANGVDAKSQLQYVYEAALNAPEPELFYLNANRLGAQEFVPVSERKVGGSGEYLFTSFEKMKGKALPEEFLKFKGSKTISYQLSQWLSSITGSSTELITEEVSGQVKVSFRVKEIESNVSPFNLGAGMSYLAKVLIICLMAKKGDLILLENPEIQLHPKSQAQLGAFLAFIASNGIQLVVETHCEHLINKVAYQVYDDALESKDVIVHYKPSVDQPFETLLIDDNGEFNDIEANITSFPTGFFDATLTDLMKMR